jgi:hypothetical protein
MTADLFWKVAIAAVGGTWTVLNYLRGRTFRRRLELKVTGQITVEGELHFLSITATVKNVGLSKARIFQEGTWVKLFRLSSKPTGGALSLPGQAHLGTAPVFKEHAWVEPGEEINDVLFVQLPAKQAEDIAIRLNLRVKSQDRRWMDTSDFEEKGSAPESDYPFVRNLTWAAAAVVPYNSAASQPLAEAPTTHTGAYS